MSLAVMTIGLLYFEYHLDENQLIRSLGHWLVYLQLIKYFLPKTSEDDWFLFLLGLMQVLIGAVVSQSDRIGLWLFAWAMLAIWVLGQFFLQREAARFLSTAGSPGPGVLRARATDPYAGTTRPALRPGHRPRPGDDPGSGRPDLPHAAPTGGRDEVAVGRADEPAPDRLRRGGRPRPVRRDPRERDGGDDRRIHRHGGQDDPAPG